MWVPVAVWQPCELLYSCYLLTYFRDGNAACCYWCSSWTWRCLCCKFTIASCRAFGSSLPSFSLKAFLEAPPTSTLSTRSPNRLLQRWRWLLFKRKSKESLLQSLQWRLPGIVFVIIRLSLHRHTHTPVLRPFFRDYPGWAGTRKVKTNLVFTETRDSEWQWHQLGRMQVYTSLQIDNHARIPPLSFFTGRMPFLPPNQQRQSTEGKFFFALQYNTIQ